MSHIRFTTVVALSLTMLAGFTPALRAQQRSAPPIGQRVRTDVLLAEPSHVRRQHAQPLVGTLLAVHGDTFRIAVHPSADAVLIPRSAVQRFYQSVGRPGRIEGALRNAWLPTLLAGTLGAVMASAGSTPGLAPGQAALRRATTTALVTGLIGAVAPRERWRRVDLTPAR